MISQKNKGFTLLELMITLAIGMFILTTVVIGQSKYTDSAALKGLVNDISLTLRQAQVYGLSVKENTPGDFKTSYGIFFNAFHPTEYIYFGDTGATMNGNYDGTNTVCTGECIQLVQITKGNQIVNPICRIDLTNAETCDVWKVSIVFVRPAPEAKMTLYSTSGAPLSMTGYKGVRVKFISPQGIVRSIVVYTTGQISVQ